jgi:hypothetical protein
MAIVWACALSVDEYVAAGPRRGHPRRRPGGAPPAVLRERGPAALADAGFSWERLSGWLPGGMDADAWAAVIPSMGVMALVRNLHNFEEAGVGGVTVDTVIAKITDPDQVAKARLFPYQVWAARHFDPKRHGRVVLFTDDQQHDSGHVRLDHVPLIYTLNLAGYGPSALPAGQRGRHTLSGFTDATFTVMKVLEGGRNAGWPFMASPGN